MSDDPKPINVSPEFEQLSEECEILKEELAALFIEWEHLTQAIIPNIEAEYIVKIGTLQHELLQVQIDVQRIKREIDIIQTAFNRGETIDELQIQQQLENEFTDWKVQLDAQLRDLQQAEKYLGALMPIEDYAELRKIYRILAKILHPDVNPNQSKEAQNLWLQVQSAYETGDIKQLQALHLLADEIPDNYDLPNSIDILKKRRADFKDQIKNMLQKMADLKSLPIFKWEKFLDNPELVTEEQRSMRDQISQAKEKYSALQIVLHQLKRGMVNE